MSQVKAGAAYVELLLRKSEFLKGLQAAQLQLERFANSAQLVGRAMIGIGTAGLLPLLGIAKSAASAGAALSDLADRTGVPASSLSELSWVAEQSGTSIEALGGALFRMRRRIANAASGGGPASRALRDLGDQAKAITKLPVEQQFNTIVEKLAGVRNESMRAQYAFEIFGDAAKAILPMLNRGTAGIEAFREQARQFGLAISDVDASALAKMNDSFSNIQLTLRGLITQIGAALAPAITKMNEVIRIYLKQAIDWVKNNREVVVGAFKAAGAVIAAGAALIGAAGGIKLFAFGLGLITAAMTTVAKYFAIASMVVGTFTKYLVNVGGGSALAGLIKSISAVVALIKSIANPVGRITGLFRLAGSAAAGIAGMFRAAVAAIISAWQSLVARFTFANLINAEIGLMVAAFLSANNVVSRAVNAVVSTFASLGSMAAEKLQYISDAFGAMFSDVADGASGVKAAFGAAITDLVSRLGGLKDAAFETWGGIANAFASGDLGAAMKVGWTAIKLAWAEGTQFVLSHWTDLKNSLWDVADAMTYGLAGILTDGWASVENLWVETIDFLFDAWDGFIGALATTWHSTVGFIKKAWVKLKSLFDSDLDVDAEVNRINQETADKNSTAFSSIADREARRKQRKAQIERDRIAARETLDAMRTEGKAARQSQGDSVKTDAAKELEKARADWQAAVKAAKDLTPPAPLLAIEEEVKEEAERNYTQIEASKSESHGTFSAAAIRGMGASSLSDRATKAAEATAENTARIIEELKNGGMTFT